MKTTDKAMMSLRIAIVTVSDRASSGAYRDESGPAACEALEQALGKTPLAIEAIVVPDDPSAIEVALRRFVEAGLDIVLTTGGTGIGPRDATPEATRRVTEKEIPGIAEAIRAFSMRETANAMLSRGTAGLAGRTLIANLPGSPRAARSIAAFLAPPLLHAISMIRGEDVHASKSSST